MNEPKTERMRKGGYNEPPCNPRPAPSLPAPDPPKTILERLRGQRGYVYKQAMGLVEINRLATEGWRTISASYLGGDWCALMGRETSDER